MQRPTIYIYVDYRPTIIGRGEIVKALEKQRLHKEYKMLHSNKEGPEIKPLIKHLWQVAVDSSSLHDFGSGNSYTRANEIPGITCSSILKSVYSTRI